RQPVVSRPHLRWRDGFAADSFRKKQTPQQNRAGGVAGDSRRETEDEMNALAAFKAVLEVSWQGSLAILVIVAVRPLLGARIPARWRALLWLLVIVRLLLPTPLLPRTLASMDNLPVAAHPVERIELAWE